MLCLIYIAIIRLIIKVNRICSHLQLWIFSQLWTFSFYFHNQPDDCCILAKTCSLLYLIIKNCVWTEYTVLPLLLALQLSVIFGLLSNSLPCVSIRSHLTPILNLHFPRSVVTSSSHLHLALPILLIAGGLYSVFLFTILSLSVLAVCPIHLILCGFIYPTLSACLISKSGYSLVVTLQLPSWLGCMSSLLLSLQTWVYYTSCYTNFVSVVLLQKATKLDSVKQLLCHFNINGDLSIKSDIYECLAFFPCGKYGVINLSCVFVIVYWRQVEWELKDSHFYKKLKLVAENVYSGHLLIRSSMLFFLWSICI